MNAPRSKSLIDFFVQHKVAATLLMVSVFLLGFWALAALNVQLLPDFSLDVVTVKIAWKGASPGDVEKSISTPVEEALRQLNDEKKIVSVSSRGLSHIVIEFRDTVILSEALAQVRNVVAQVRNLPKEALKPVISSAPLRRSVARVVLFSDRDDLHALESYAYRFQRELLDRGLASVTIQGLPKKEIQVSVSPGNLAAMHQSLMGVGHHIVAHSQDVTAGEVGQASGGRQLRATQKAETLEDYHNLPIAMGDAGLLMQLGNMASVRWAYTNHPHLVFYQGKPAIMLYTRRVKQENALSMATILHEWLEQARATLPQGMHLHVFNERWKMIVQRINVLLKNGVGGLILIVLLLTVFFNLRTAWWVAMGIPISLLAAVFVLKLSGGSINMITMFAMIMSLGIIVDDTIVVAEQAISECEAGVPVAQAAINGAKKMFVPIIAASLTTVAAFLPLLLLGGVFGKVLVAIPQVVIAVVLASLVECFLILPMHLKFGLKKLSSSNSGKLQVRVNHWFDQLRFVRFRAFISKAVHYPWVTLALGVGSVIVTVGVVVAGHIGFVFFPAPTGREINADVTFASGTPTHVMKKQLLQIEQAAWQVNNQLKAKNGNLITSAVINLHKGTDRYETRSRHRIGSLMLELVSTEDRTLSNTAFSALWKKAIHLMPCVEGIRIMAPRAGPPGSEIDVALSGATAPALKAAAQALVKKLLSYPGVYSVSDNFPYSQADVIFALRDDAKSLGLTVSDVGAQLQAGYTGYLAAVLNKKQSEIEVRVKLGADYANQLSSLDHFPIVTPAGRTVPLSLVVQLKSQKSFDTLVHLDRALTVNVQGEVDMQQGNTNKIIQSLQANFLPTLAKRYSLEYSMKGKTQDQEKMIVEMKYALVLALSLIYIVLAWVSGSYLWPLFVMLAIPLGLEGAIWGHLILQKSLTLLSLFGFFGLTGIVINDSIILLFRYKELVDDGMDKIEAIIEAACVRFRAVVLTSVTTIAGLLPLLFERSYQAQFLIPMAISICFGLAFATVLILVLIPSALAASVRLGRAIKTLD